MATFRIRAAISAPASDLAPDLPRSIDLPSGSVSLQIGPAGALTERARDAVYTLYNDNMGSITAGSPATYTEASKREELFDPSTRYLLVLRPSTRSSSSDTLAMPGALPSEKDRKGKARASVDFEQDDLLGYCSFRFDTEETLGPRDVEVVYCYELQLKPEVRGQGLGEVLMDELEKIGRDRGMAKSMLTCMKKNETALRFYAKQGYQPDEIDPTRMAAEESEEDDEDEEWQEVGSDGEPVPRDDDEVDYTILSKNLQLQ